MKKKNPILFCEKGKSSYESSTWQPRKVAQGATYEALPIINTSTQKNRGENEGERRKNGHGGYRRRPGVATGGNYLLQLKKSGRKSSKKREGRVRRSKRPNKEGWGIEKEKEEKSQVGWREHS